MNNKIPGWLVALIIGVCVVGLATSIPTAHARSDNPILDGTSAISSLSANCLVSTPTAAAQESVGVETRQFTLREEIMLVQYRIGLSYLAIAVRIVVTSTTT